MNLNNKLIGCDKEHEWIKKNQNPYIQKIISQVTYGVDIGRIPDGLLAQVEIYLSDTVKIGRSEHLINNPIDIIKFIIKSFEECLYTLENRESIKKIPEME